MLVILYDTIRRGIKLGVPGSTQYLCTPNLIPIGDDQRIEGELRRHIRYGEVFKASHVRSIKGVVRGEEARDDGCDHARGVAAARV